ncbi:MAG: hypothetical protein NTX25_23200, partial [Proteobacteria bacterium]|nr:hypothetical protein [Pseudomonadota bacterium]
GTMSATANCIISSDDKLLCFGNFGLSDYWIDKANMMTEAWNLQTSAVPQTVSISGDNPAVCVSFDDGTLRCTGYNSHGQLGLGFPVNRFAPPAAAVTRLEP